MHSFTLLCVIVPNTETNTSVRYALCTNTAQCYMQAPWWQTTAHTSGVWMHIEHCTMICTHGYYSAHFNLLDFILQFYTIHSPLQISADWTLSTINDAVIALSVNWTSQFVFDHHPVYITVGPFVFRISTFYIPHTSVSPGPFVFVMVSTFLYQTDSWLLSGYFFNHNSIAIVIFFWCLEVYTCDILFPSIFLRLKHFLQWFLFQTGLWCQFVFWGLGTGWSDFRMELFSSFLLFLFVFVPSSISQQWWGGQSLARVDKL